MAFKHVDTTASVHFEGCARGRFIDYGIDANEALEAALLPTRDNRALRQQLTDANARRLTHKGYRAAQVDKRPSDYREAEIMVEQAKRVAWLVVGLVNKIVERGFEGSELALFDLLDGEAREDVRALRWIWNNNLKSAAEYEAKRAAWQEEREARALVRANLKTLRDQARAEVFANT
jgi:hypothetical protein